MKTRAFTSRFIVQANLVWTASSFGDAVKVVEAVIEAIDNPEREVAVGLFPSDGSGYCGQHVWERHTSGYKWKPRRGLPRRPEAGIHRCRPVQQSMAREGTGAEEERQARQQHDRRKTQ